MRKKRYKPIILKIIFGRLNPLQTLAAASPAVFAALPHGLRLTRFASRVLSGVRTWSSGTSFDEAFFWPTTR